MKQQIKRNEYYGWVRGLDGLPISKAIMYLQRIQIEAHEKGFGDPVLQEDGEYGSWMEVSREETDEEYNNRLIREQREKDEALKREKRQFEMLYEKYGEPEKPKYLPYDEWLKIARPTMEPILSQIPTPSVVDIMLRDAYKKYVEVFK